MSFEDEGELSAPRLRELFIEEFKCYEKKWWYKTFDVNFLENIRIEVV